MLATPRLAATAVSNRRLHPLNHHAAQPRRSHPLPAVVFEGSRLAEVVYAKLWFSGRASGSPATGANTDGKVMSLLVMPPQLDDILIQKGFPPTVYIRRPGSYCLTAYYNAEDPSQVSVDVGCGDLADVLAFLPRPAKEEAPASADQVQPPTTIRTGCQPPPEREQSPGGVPLPYVDNTHLPCIDWSRAADGGATAAFSEYQFNDQQYRQVAVVSLSAGDVYRLRLVFEATMPGLCGFGASTPFDFHAKAVNV